MRNAIRLLPLCLLATGATALSPKLSVRQYSHTAWTDAGGEPFAPVQAFAQTRDGYLLLSTGAGQFRFDGLRFSPWPVAVNGPVREALVARDGSLWLAAASGLSRVRDGSVREYPLQWQRAALNGLFEDSSGFIWVTVETETESFIQSLSPGDGAVRRFGAAEGVPKDVRAMALDGGAFWLATEGAVCRWTPGATSTCRAVPGPIQSLALAAPGVVYAASSTAIYRVAPERVDTLVPRIAGAGSLRPRMLLVDRHGNLWAGATGGVLRVRNSEVELLGRKDGLSGDLVTGILEDHEGDIWVATNNGIDRFRNPRILHVSMLDGLSGEFATAIKAANDGSIWVGTSGRGLNRIQGRDISHYSVADGLPANTVTALETDAAGRIWVACGDKLVCRQNGRFERIGPTRATDPVYAMAADSRGRVWAAGNALWRISGSVAESLDPEGAGDILRVFAPRRGPLWLASSSRGVMTLSSEMAATSAFPALNGMLARAFLEDESGAVWIAAGASLGRVRGGKLTTWGPQQGLSAGEIFGLAGDRRGALWLTTDRALVRVAFSELARSPDGEPGPARFVHYDETDGLRPAQRGGMWHPRITTAADGRVWFCERDGVGVVDPDMLAETAVPPPVVIEQLLVDGVAQTGSEPRFRGRQVQVAYTANSLMAPERVRFRYRLEGNAPHWTEVQGRRELTFVDLPPGYYRFRVVACNLDNVCNEAGAAAPFVVMPYYYQTIWFKLLLSAAAWLVMWGGYKLRMGQVVSRYRLVAEDRARVTREIHDSLLQGFAGVVLQLEAASRLFNSNPADSKERLDRALDQADESLREARQMLLDLRLPILEGRPLSEALADVGETTTRGTSIAFSLKIRGNERPLPYTSQVALYLIGREAIRNAVHHATPSRISALIAFEDKECCLRVQDDGSGFVLATEGRKPGHLGVQGMRERAREAGARFSIESAPRAGTTVEVIVPYKAGRPALPM